MENESCSNRKNTINNTDIKNASHIKHLFPNIIPPTYTTSMENIYPLEKVPMYNETDKFGIFYSLKGGSTLIYNALTKNKYSILGEDTHFDYNTKKFNEIQSLLSFKPAEQLNLDVAGELKLMLNGKSKKDLILVIRNPTKKFISGLIMDIIHKIFNSPLKHKFGLIDHGSVYSIPDIEWDSIIENYLLNVIDDYGKIDFNHAKLYNESYIHILTNYNIDLSKLKIVDLDNPSSDISELLCRYYPELTNNPDLTTFWTQRNFHNKFMNAMYSILSKKNNHFLLERIRKEVYSDYFYYQVIYQKFNKNIYISGNV